MNNIKTDQGNNPLLNTNFLLRVEANFDLPCKRITGISQEKEYEPIQAGGVNDYVFLREKPVSKPSTLKVERYIGSGFFDPLPVGKRLELPLVLYVSRKASDFKTPKQTFSFSGCVVMSKEYGELDAEKSGLMLETTTIAYQTMTLEVSSKEQEQKDESGTLKDTMLQFAKKQGKKQTQKAVNEVKRRIWPKVRSARTISDLK